MKETLFRGKHTHMFSSNKPLDGMWCYGYLVDKNYINDKTDRGDGEYLGEMLVDIETIGQYTGLKDKNGKKIFEGDIVKHHNGILGAVFYNTSHCAYVLQDINGNRNRCQFDRLGNYSSLWIEVIGNIHDDKELTEDKR